MFLLINTLRLTLTTCAISVPLGIALAWVLARTDLPGRRMALGLLGLMLFVPLYLDAAAWQAGFGQQGWLGLAYGLPPLLDGWAGVVWIHAMAAVPWVVLIVGAGLRLLEPELEEQALLDGSPGQVFLRVVLQGCWPAIAVATLWVAVGTAGEMTVTDLFAVRTYAEEIYTQAVMQPDLQGLWRNLLPGIVGTVAMLSAGLLLAARWMPHDRPLSLRRELIFPLGRARVPMAVAVALILLLLAGIPLGNLFYKAGVLVAQTESGRVRTWSAVKCLSMVAGAPWAARRELGASLLVGGLAATAAAVAAIPLAWFARGRRGRMPVLVLAAVALATPGPVVGLAVIAVLNRPEIPGLFELYDHSILAPWLALGFRSLPAALLVLWHGFRTVPQAVLDSAAVDGAGSVGQLLRIVLPMRWPTVVLAWLVGLAVAIGDLAASILVVPPGLTTLSIHIFGLLHYGVEDQAAAICLAMIGLFAVVAVAARWISEVPSPSGRQGIIVE
jgi:iron(III) transport system permease protein